MQLHDERLPSMSDPTPASAAKVHVVKPMTAAPLPAAAPQPDAQPLRIDYLTTQVIADALVRLQRTHGVVRMDRSALAESFKMLRNQVLQRMRADGHKLLAVTSPRRIEGKSLTAVNLAISLAADYDSAVLLVDADLASHGLQALFGLEGARGLSDYLTDDVAIPELLINPGIPRFVLLPAGREAVLNSAELLSTKRAQQLILEMKARYQDRYIIVDLPPLLDTADALAFLPLADTTLVVIEEHSTSIQDMEAMNEMLTPFNLIGSVMSQPREATPAAGGATSPWYRRWLRRAQPSR
jgi:Mrp family chromosome partitioning ATPase